VIWSSAEYRGEYYMTHTRLSRCIDQIVVPDIIHSARAVAAAAVEGVCGVEYRVYPLTCSGE
jgi:hypothetical protein